MLDTIEGTKLFVKCSTVCRHLYAQCGLNVCMRGLTFNQNYPTT